ncbi:hypothetical protein [Halothiobacillus sp. DCM-1]|uniref:hypothetical protein n=1 Tax=Halothiobacillus sp. DCM-1 TaxID=3112558 RepID=UPI00324B1F5E
MPSLLQLLEPLIGTQLTVGGTSGTVIEVLSDPPALVLMTGDKPPIECDHLGRPQQRVPDSQTVSLLSPQGTALAPDLQRQLPTALAHALQRILIEPDEAG